MYAASGNTHIRVFSPCVPIASSMASVTVKGPHLRRGLAIVKDRGLPIVRCNTG